LKWDDDYRKSLWINCHPERDTITKPEAESLNELSLMQRIRSVAASNSQAEGLHETHA